MKKVMFFLCLITILLLNSVCCCGFVCANNNNLLILTHLDKEFNLNLTDYQPISNIHAIIWQASKLGQNKSLKEKANKIDDYLKSGFSYNISFDMVFPNLSKDITKIAKKIKTGSKNAKLQLSGTKFKIIPEKEGLELDFKTFYKQLLDKIKTSDCSKMQIPTMKTKAQYCADDLKQSQNLRSSFATDISKSTQERKNNISKALGRFNGIMIYPNETISFNKITGRRTIENGYSEAKIIVNGEYVAGVGGGVCQASTTIYNACLLAGLKCTANNHSIPPTYVEKGLDAMVNVGSSDLKITNTNPFSIYIQAYSTNSKAIVKVFGEKLNGIIYKTKTEITEETKSKGYKIIKDKNQEYKNKVNYVGETFIKQYATNGFKTNTFLLTYKNNKLIKKELIRKSIYPPSEGIIIEGTQEKPKAIPDLEEKIDGSVIF